MYFGLATGQTQLHQTNVVQWPKMGCLCQWKGFNFKW